MADEPKPEVLIVGRRPGRPKALEPHSIVSVYVPARLHDRLIALARTQDASVSAIARQILVSRIYR